MKLRTKIILAATAAVVVFLAVYSALFVPFGPSSGPPIEATGIERTALLVLDMQVDFLSPRGRLPVDQTQVKPMIDLANRLATDPGDRFDIDPVYIANAFSSFDFIGNLARNHAAVEGSNDARLDPRLELVGDTVFHKQLPDAFSNEQLDAYLRAERITKLVVVGVFADQCVRSTVQAALNRGYEVAVVQDGVAAATAADREQAYADLVDDGAKIVKAGRFVE